MSPKNHYNAPGIYIEEVSSFRPAVPVLPTSVPAFLVQTFNEEHFLSAKKIESFVEYELLFGKGGELDLPVRLYFDNGGAGCVIVSLGSLVGSLGNYVSALELLLGMEEVTLIAAPHAVSLPRADYAALIRAMLQHCAACSNRFALIDVQNGLQYNDDVIAQHRADVGDESLAFGASYFPFLKIVEGDSVKYVPPSAAVAGIICSVDANRGVWKAPANVSLTGIDGLAVALTNDAQQILNIDVTSGKSINALRYFEGKGNLVWGARTLAGNDNEWRYIPVRRTCSWIASSVQKALQPFSFEPNDDATWNKVSAMIWDYLNLLWRQGALQGAKPEEAFYVAVGVNRTMTTIDVLEGRMIVEVGLAMVRPAEFILIRITQNILSSS